MTSRFISLTILTAFAFIFLTLSCKNTNKTKDTGPKIEITSTIETKNVWPDNNQHKEFKIDTSGFKIFASKSSWSIHLERTKSFESQLNKIKQTLKLISNASDLKELKQVSIFPNYELLSDIAKVPEIQEELRQSANQNRIVKSMSVISNNAHKSTYLKGITNLFSTQNLEPHSFYIDKCREKKTEKDSMLYTMHCATIAFNLRELSF